MYNCRLYNIHGKSFTAYLTDDLTVIGLVEIGGRDYMNGECVVFVNDNLTSINDGYLKNKIKNIVIEHLNDVKSIINSLD